MSSISLELNSCPTALIQYHCIYHSRLLRTNFHNATVRSVADMLTILDMASVLKIEILSRHLDYSRKLEYDPKLWIIAAKAG
jgi:hypothetical protein